ncbi:hypothetical protein Hypma_001506 [Hypsizygus marmoreus]|uniref:Uncharacterized protein n=1 Tax=Hypsizygus marmoreus TaxID=39966 RepID=A0A369K4C8_HYPMA|nr:hypothetical protein Hypma_001506 [Hypsizygus marmoreus]
MDIGGYVELLSHRGRGACPMANPKTEKNGSLTGFNSCARTGVHALMEVLILMEGKSSVLRNVLWTVEIINLWAFEGIYLIN